MLNAKGERKLVNIVEIEEVKDIEKADRIQAYRVGGWWIVDGKGKYQRGDVCFMFEIDSLLDTTRPAFMFLAKDGKTHHRLRTMKMKGQISEGLLLPINTAAMVDVLGQENPDWDKYFGVTKYEAPEPKGTGPRRVGGASYKTFPSFLKKTDQERIENRTQYLSDYKTKWEITRKLDGSSMTVGDYDDAGIMVRQKGYRKTWFNILKARLKALFVKPDTFFVCSRQVNLPDVPSCNFWKVAKKYNLRELLKGHNIALQGELIGPGVNGNWEGLKDHDFFVFDIWDIKKQQYYTPLERQEWMNTYGQSLKHVPIIEPEMFFNDKFNTVEALKTWCKNFHTEEEMNFNTTPEGYVWKSLTNAGISFKCINHDYLLSKKD